MSPWGLSQNAPCPRCRPHRINEFVHGHSVMTAALTCGSPAISACPTASSSAARPVTTHCPTARAGRRVRVDRATGGTTIDSIHEEKSGQGATELTEGTKAIIDAMLQDRCHTYGNTGFNAQQCLALAFLMAEALECERHPGREVS